MRRIFGHAGSRWLVWLAIALACGCGGLPPQPVAPQRPSFSSDTSTTAPGTLEFEAGVSVDDKETLDSPLAAKWGATEETELFVGWSPYVRAPEGGLEEGVGDIVIGTRVRFVEANGAKPGGAFELTTKLPVADSDNNLGTGLVDFFGAAIATSHFNSSTLTGFYQFGVLSNPGSDVGFSHALSVAWGHPISHNVGGFVELTGVFTPSNQADQAFAIAGLGYDLRSSVVLDAAGLLGLTKEAPDYLLTVGATINVGKLSP